MKRFNSLVSLIILVAFTFNTAVSDYAFALAPSPASVQPEKIEEVYAAAQREFAAWAGPGIVPFEEYAAYAPHNKEITGEVPEISGFKLVINHRKLPDGWENNPLLKNENDRLLKKNLNIIKAFEYFRDVEARLPKDLVIKEGYWDLEKPGELPMPRWQYNKYTEKWELAIHIDFIKKWNDIRENDVWFEYTFSEGFLEGQTRTVSLAWAIFYHVAKHEMGAIHKYDSEEGKGWKEGQKKGGGHFGKDDTEPNPREDLANAIGGNYAELNDSLWMWFLGSYSCPGYNTKYNNDIAKDRYLWFFGLRDAREEGEIGYRVLKDQEAYEMGLTLEFAWALENISLIKPAVDIALNVNKAFYDKYIPPAPESEEDLKKLDDLEYENFVSSHLIGETVSATGKDGRDQISTPEKRDNESPIERKILNKLNTDLDGAIKLLTLNHHELSEEQLNRIAKRIKDVYRGPIKIVGKVGGSTISFEASTPAGLLGYRETVKTNLPDKTDGIDTEEKGNRLAGGS